MQALLITIREQERKLSIDLFNRAVAYHPISSIVSHTTLTTLNIVVENVVSSKPLSMISYFTGDDHAIKVLNEHHVLREFLLKNAGWYFKSDANSQWIHNNEFAQYVDYVEKIFSYIEWDDVVMETLDSSIYTFYESFRTRYNQDSITNGERFEDSCRRVLAANISKIKEVPDWESYKNIYKMITGKESEWFAVELGV